MKHPRLWAACLALLPLALVPAPAFAQAPVAAPSPAAPVLIGTVAKISIVGIKNISTDTVQSKLTLKVGDAYTPEAAAKDVAAIKSMGVFNAVSPAAAPSDAGVALTYTVAENPVVQSIKFTANTPSGQPSILDADLIAQMKTRSGDVLNTNVLVSDLNNLFNHTSATAGYVVKQGYLMDVSSDINIDPKTGILTIPLVEYHIKSIEITGNSRIKTEDIRAQMQAKTGGIFSTATLNQDASTLYESGSFRTVNANWNVSKPGEIALKISVVEQAPATGILDEKQGKVIPLLYDPPVVAYPLVEVSVNGHSPLTFILDTGSSPALSLNFWAAKELSLKVISEPQTENGFTFTRVPIANAVLLGRDRSNDVTIDTKEAFVLDLSLLDQTIPHSHIAGIIGYGALLQVTARFDFAAKTLTVFTMPHPPLRVSDGIMLPLRGDNTPTARATLAPGIYADLIVDTGCNSTQVPLSTLKFLRPEALTCGNLSQVDGDYVLPEMRLPKMDFGALHISNVVVTVKPPPTGPSLGLDILTGYRLTLDGPNGQLFLESSAQSRRYTQGRSGLDIKQVGKKWLVSRLKAKLPAQDAGLQVGDELITVGGINVNGLSLNQVGAELSGIMGRPVQVSVNRKSKVLALAWTPVDAFHVSPSVMDGLTMRKPSGTGFWVIEDIIQGCAGSRAGLQEGDKITRINGHPVTDKPTESFGEVEEPQSALFEIQRAGIAKPFTVRLTAAK